MNPFRTILLFAILVCGKAWPSECGPKLRQLGTSEFFVYGDDTVSPKQEAEILEVLRSVDTMVSPVLEVPSGQVVALSRKGIPQYAIYIVYAPFQMEVEIELKSGKKKQLIKHPVWSKASHAHEYGHAIFDLNFERRLPGWKDCVARHEDVNIVHVLWKHSLNKLEQIEQEMKRRGLISGEDLEIWENISRDRLADGSINGGVPKKFSDAIFEQWSAVKEQTRVRAAAVHDLSPEDQQLIDRVTPYSEVFCDSVPVLLYRDGQAIQRTIPTAGLYSHRNRKLALRAVEGRDFTARNKAAEWQNSRDHPLFGPARTHLWRHYFSNPLYADKRAQLLDLLLDVIADEVKAGGDMVPRAANERFIKAIDQKFKSLVLPLPLPLPLPVHMSPK